MLPKNMLRHHLCTMQASKDGAIQEMANIHIQGIQKVSGQHRSTSDNNSILHTCDWAA